MRGLYLTQNRESARRDFIRKASKLGGNKKGASQLSNRRNRLLLFQFFLLFYTKWRRQNHRIHCSDRLRSMHDDNNWKTLYKTNVVCDWLDELRERRPTGWCTQFLWAFTILAREQTKQWLIIFDVSDAIPGEQPAKNWKHDCLLNLLLFSSNWPFNFL